MLTAERTKVEASRLREALKRLTPPRYGPDYVSFDGARVWSTGPGGVEVEARVGEGSFPRGPPRRPLLGLLEEVEGRWRWPSWRGGSWCGRPPPGGAPHRSSLLPGRQVVVRGVVRERWW